MIELGGQLRFGQHRLLEAVEAAAARDDQRHRLARHLLVAIAGEREQQIVAARRAVQGPEAMLLDAAHQSGAQLAIVQRARPLENRRRDRNMRGFERCHDALFAREMVGQTRPQRILDADDQPPEQRCRGDPLPLGKPGRVRQQQIGRGHGETLARGRQQQPRRVALSVSSVRHSFGHRPRIAHTGLNRC